MKNLYLKVTSLDEFVAFPLPGTVYDLVNLIPINNILTITDSKGNYADTIVIVYKNTWKTLLGATTNYRKIVILNLNGQAPAIRESLSEAIKEAYRKGEQQQILPVSLYVPPAAVKTATISWRV